MTAKPEQNTFYVYVHKRADDGQVFYVGKGNKGRAFSKNKRNKLWHNIVKKHGYIVEIVSQNLSNLCACAEEIKLIKEYGRRDLGTGCLCNMTDGGDGFNGFAKHPRLGKSHSEDTKKRISETKKNQENLTWVGRHHSEETKAKISEKNKGRVPPNKGIPRTEEFKRAHSERMKGRPAPNKGKKMSPQQIEKLRQKRLTSSEKMALSKAHVERFAGKTKGYLMDKCGKFYSQITVFGKTYHIGYFDKEEDAAASYKWCREQLKQFGEVDISRFRKNKDKPVIIKEPLV